MVKGIVLMV